MHTDNVDDGGPFRWGLELTPDVPIRSLVEAADAAEEAGIDAVFASSHYNNRDPFVALGHVAAATESIQLGVAVENPYETHPVRLASRVATLEEVSDGRALFGLGAGDRSTLSTLGIHRDGPVRAVLETMRVARRLWAGERVHHDGTFVAEAAQLSYETGPVPLFVGAQGPHMLRMAAKHADGVLVNAAHPADYAWASEQITHGLEERPADRNPFTVAAFASVSVAEDADAAREAARPAVAYIAAGASDRVLERHDLDVGHVEEIRDALAAGDRDGAYDLVTPALVDVFCIAGAPEMVVERAEELTRYVDAVVAASPLGPDRVAAIELLGRIRQEVGERTR